HKSLSVPMGAGMFLTRHPGVLERTFRVGADYMPRDSAALEGVPVDPFAHSMQWSRRFIGLKLFLSLAADGWQVVNDTPLPLVCLARSPGGDPPEFTAAPVRQVVGSGQAWVSAAALP